MIWPREKKQTSTANLNLGNNTQTIVSIKIGWCEFVMNMPSKPKLRSHIEPNGDFISILSENFIMYNATAIKWMWNKSMASQTPFFFLFISLTLHTRNRIELYAPSIENERYRIEK